MIEGCVARMETAERKLAHLTHNMQQQTTEIKELSKKISEEATKREDTMETIQTMFMGMMEQFQVRSNKHMEETIEKRFETWEKKLQASQAPKDTVRRPTKHKDKNYYAAIATRTDSDSDSNNDTDEDTDDEPSKTDDSSVEMDVPTQQKATNVTQEDTQLNRGKRRPTDRKRRKRDERTASTGGGRKTSP